MVQKLRLKLMVRIVHLNFSQVRYIIFLLVVLTSCHTTNSVQRVKPKKITIDNLREKNELWMVKNNPYVYFMIDSTNNAHLVKTHFSNSSKVIWIEKLNKKNR